ncbi:polysaccharide deacetylase family protein [Longispora sp. K20-0274]|uniref:polysaccharide deacetylase family protein n=1 Tax=Longispora sp. K20-0274 TaxID=3088255 RepID=UPI00399AF68F
MFPLHPRILLVAVPLMLGLVLTGCDSHPGSEAGPARTPKATAPQPTPERRQASPTGPERRPLAPALNGKAIGPGGSLQGTGGTSVALTFDDGPDPVQTPALLDALQLNHVRATFCLVGKRVKENPALVRRIVAEGHTVCNHSWEHRDDLGTLPDAAMLNDLTSTNDAIHEAEPKARIRYFRAPYGKFTKRLVDNAALLGMNSIFWDVDDLSYKDEDRGTGEAMVAFMSKRIRNLARPGVIVLSHDYGRPQTPVTYRNMLPWLKSQFSLEPLPVADLPDGR